MEPPFYADLNNACRNLDLTQIKTLGPFAKAIFSVLKFGLTSDDKRIDAIGKGKNAQGSQYFKSGNEITDMCKSFLLFRGALMNKDWVKDWKE